MARQKGSYRLGGNLEVEASANLDGRLEVPTKADLLTMEYPYQGMIVFCQEDEKHYKLVGDHALEASWEEVCGVPDGGTTEQILAKASDEDGDAEWVEDIGRSLTRFDRKYGAIPAQKPIKQVVATYIGVGTDVNSVFSVPIVGVITNADTFMSGILNTFDVFSAWRGGSEVKLTELIQEGSEYRLFRTTGQYNIGFRKATVVGSAVQFEAYIYGAPSKIPITQVRLVARGDYNFGTSDGTASYDIRNLTGMVLDDLKVTGNAVPTDWGIATSNVLRVNKLSPDTQTSIDVSGFGFKSGNDYQVVFETVGGGDMDWGSTVYFLFGKTATSFTFTARNFSNSANQDYVEVAYTIFAKGYGNNRMDGGSGGGTITVDTAMSDSSENPVQNKVITAEVNSLDLRIVDLNSEMVGAKTSIAKLDTSIGNMSSLSTSAKTTIVEAINEIANKGGGGAFDDLSGRPLYNGMPMTSATVIPYVSNHLSELSNSGTRYTMGGNVTGDLDMELTIDASNNNATLQVYDTVSQDIVASKTLQGQLTAGANITIDANNVISASGGGGTVDQSYNAYSTNAQSGTAVAEAIDDMASYSADTTTAIYQGIVSHGNDSLAFWLDTDTVGVTMASPSVYYKSMTLPTKDYADTKAAQAQSTAQTYTDLKLTQKQDKLTSGTNIKTVNGESLLGSGNLNVGVNIEINKEKWYGTYTDENGVTYQVYSKMIYIPALPSTAGITAYDHGISGIKQILQVYGFTADGFVLNAPRQTASDNIAIYQMSKSASNKTLSIEVGKDRSSKSAYVVMVYAKNR